MHVVLVGLMASGKTSVGRPLARLLERPFLDNDDQLEALTGRTAREVSQAEGPDELHRLEAEALRQALASAQRAVVAAAAATVLDAAIRRALEPELVVWLDASPEALAARAGGGSHRPLGPDPLETLRGMWRERRPYYEDVADLVVDTDDLRRAPAIAEELASRLGAGQIGDIPEDDRIPSVQRGARSPEAGPPGRAG